MKYFTGENILNYDILFKHTAEESFKLTSAKEDSSSVRQVDSHNHCGPGLGSQMVYIPSSDTQSNPPPTLLNADLQTSGEGEGVSVGPMLE